MYILGYIVVVYCISLRRGVGVNEIIIIIIITVEEGSGRSQPSNIVSYYYVLVFPDAETMVHEEDTSVLSELCYFQVHCSLKGYTVSTGKKGKKKLLEIMMKRVGIRIIYRSSLENKQCWVL